MIETILKCGDATAPDFGYQTAVSFILNILLKQCLSYQFVAVETLAWVTNCTAVKVVFVREVYEVRC